MLSQSSKYGIQGVLYIANYTSIGHKLGAKEIASKLNISRPFLAKTLQELVRENIISSAKGPKGGFFLTKENENKTIFDIIKVIDGGHKFDNCFLGQPECNSEKPCVVHHLYAPFKEQLIEKLKTKTIIEMAKEHASDNHLITLLSLKGGCE